MSDLNNLSGWPEKVKLMQKNWIGKSFGCEIDFQFTVKMKKLKYLQLDQIQYLVLVLLPYQLIINKQQFWKFKGSSKKFKSNNKTE